MSHAMAYFSTKFCLLYIDHKNIGFTCNDFVSKENVKIYARTFFCHFLKKKLGCFLNTGCTCTGEPKCHPHILLSIVILFNENKFHCQRL